MIWANFLHIYQPPTQKPQWVQKIARESYRKLTKGFLDNPQAKATINVNGVLLEHFDANGCRDVIEDLKKLGERGQLEFTASAKFHPFLPLMPEREIVRQIHLNTETCKKYLGDAYAPRGFFPPEMAYSAHVGAIVARLGFEWFILDELAFSGEIGGLDPNTIYTLADHPNCAVFFRDRGISFRILSAEVNFAGEVSFLLKDRLQNEYVITAMDGETFGHHRPGLENLLFALYRDANVSSATISEVMKHSPSRTPVTPRDSTWAILKRDIQNHTPFSRWSNPTNAIHKDQWELTNLAIHEVERYEDTGTLDPRIRPMLDRALHSDQYWWASAEPWWSIEMIESGAKELMDVILALPVSEEKKTRARDLYTHILLTAFDWQRSGIVDERAKAADEDVVERITTEMPYVPEEEFNALVANLTHQMDEAARTQEYERAAQLRDRVRELNEKKHELIKPRS